MKNSQGQKIRICLVNPRLEGPYPPLGLGYLVSYLKKYGKKQYEFRFVDGNYSRDMLKDILSFSPAIVGFTALSPQINEAVLLSGKLRSSSPRVLQVIGGIHASAEPKSTLAEGSFDFAVIGEGEQTFLDILDCFLEHGKDKGSYLQIPGIAFLDNSGYTATAPREEIDILDRIPSPERSIFKMQKYLSHYLIIRGLSGNRITTIHTSRGCPYKCIFCSCGIVFKKVRYFSVGYVIAEIKHLLNTYNVKSLFFSDDTFIINKQRVKEICQRFIDERLNREIKWEVQARANLIGWDDLDLLRLMKQAGCVQIDYGFETGSDRVLRFLKIDNASIEYNKRAIAVTKAAGLHVMGTFMLGVPGETSAEVGMTENFIIENNRGIDNFQVFIATPYPGAQLYEICKQRGLVEADYFAQIRRENQGGFTPFYTDSVSPQVVAKVIKVLNNLAFKKIKISEKLKWVLFNFISDPFAAFRKVYTFTIAKLRLKRAQAGKVEDTKA